MFESLMLTNGSNSAFRSFSLSAGMTGCMTPFRILKGSLPSYRILIGTRVCQSKSYSLIVNATGLSFKAAS